MIAPPLTPSARCIAAERQARLEEARCRFVAVRLLVAAGWACDPDNARAMVRLMDEGLRHHRLVGR
jgi:hypothetical protein